MNRGERLAQRNGQADRIEAEARIERISERLQLFAEQPHQRGVIAHRLRGLDDDVPDDAIGAIKLRAEHTASRAALFKRPYDIGGKRRQDMRNPLMMRQRLGKMPLRHTVGQGPERGDPSVLTPENAGDPPAQGLTEPGGHQNGRPGGEIAQCFEACARQGQRRFRRCFQSRQ